MVADPGKSGGYENAPFQLGGQRIAAGERREVSLPVARLPPATSLSLPVTVMHGSRPGPTLWVSAAIHGDEINGIDIVHKVLDHVDPRRLRGVLVAVPIVNVFGFVHQSRYLPDRRDLNRCFPGSPGGSLASRLAHLFMKQIVRQCDFGIDLHTGSDSRTNLPQIRADLDDETTRRCALAFAPPAIIHSRTRDGSLRQAAARRKIPVLLYEGGEAGRFCSRSIRVGFRGVIAVMREIGMLARGTADKSRHTVEIRSSAWIRGNRSGILRLHVQPGGRVAAGDTLGVIADPFGTEFAIVKAKFDGLIIGQTQNPVVYAGDALVHVARTPAEN